jgi:hypothetical protein
MSRLAGSLLREKGSTMTTVKPNSNAAALKAERERDKAQAMREYEAEAQARQANMMRLRALRLARENALAQAAPARRPIKKRQAVQRSSQDSAGGARWAAP